MQAHKWANSPRLQCTQQLSAESLGNILNWYITTHYIYLEQLQAFWNSTLLWWSVAQTVYSHHSQSYLLLVCASGAMHLLELEKKLNYNRDTENNVMDKLCAFVYSSR